MVPLVQCFVEGSGDGWEAACMDFDIYVTGTSLEEVRALLQVAVESYVADAMHEAEPTRSQLLTRRSPWHVRLRWRLRVATVILRRDRGELGFEGRFTLPCPA